MTTNQKAIIMLEEGWDFVQKGITKLTNGVEKGKTFSQIFDSEEYMMHFHAIYSMCTQKPPHDYSQELYYKYKESLEEHIKSTVLPSLHEKHDEFLLTELVKRWSNHKVLVNCLSRLFHYLDRYFTLRKNLPNITDVGFICFHDLAYQELKDKVRDAVISMIDQERDGKQIDGALLKKVQGVFVDIGMGKMDKYVNDFEAAMLKDTEAYYSQKAATWILEDSSGDFMLKVEECLRLEKDRVSNYLHRSSETKLLEVVRRTLVKAQPKKPEETEPIDHTAAA